MEFFGTEFSAETWKTQNKLNSFKEYQQVRIEQS